MLRIVLIYLLVLCSLMVVAQEMVINETFDDSIDIENIVISASRASLEDPLTIQNISKDEIESIYLGQDAAVLIQELSPSIVSYSDGGTDIGNYSQFRLRGIDQSRINISLNGVPLNDMVDHGTYFSNFSDFGNSIESIQIQRGVAASNRGVSSYAGAVNFESINLFNQSADGEAQVTVGSFGTLRTAAEVSSGILDKNIGIYGRFTRTSTGGYKFNSGSDSYSMFFSGGYAGDSDLLKVTAFSGKTQNGQSYLHVPLETIRQEPRTNYNDLNDIDDFEQHMVQLQYARSVTNSTSFNLTTYYNGAGGVFPFSFDGTQYMFGLNNDHYGAMANLLHETSTGTLNLGIHGYVFNRVNYEYITPLVTQPYARDFTDKDEFSAYIKYNRYLSGLNLYANVEIRSLVMDINGDSEFDLNLNESGNWTFLNTVIGLNHKINPHSSIYFSFGRSNREPTRSDILNGVVNEEKVNDFELGIKHQKEALTLQGNMFHMIFEDEITEIGALQERSYIEIRQNVDQSTRSGVELQMSYAVSSKISTVLNAALMHTNIVEYDNGSMVFRDVEHIFTPDLILQPAIRYQIGKRTAIRISGRYLTESFTELSNDPDFVLPSHFVGNLLLETRISQNLKLNLALNNIFNKLYFTEGSPIDLDFDGKVESIGYRIQPPRHFYLMARYLF